MKTEFEVFRSYGYKIWTGDQYFSDLAPITHKNIFPTKWELEDLSIERTYNNTLSNFGDMLFITYILREVSKHLLLARYSYSQNWPLSVSTSKTNITSLSICRFPLNEALAWRSIHPLVRIHINKSRGPQVKNTSVYSDSKKTSVQKNYRN